MYPEQLDEAVSAVYEAGMGEAKWVDAMSALGAPFNGNVYTVVWDTVAQRPVFEASCHLQSPDSIIDYRTHFYAVDPRLSLGLRLPIGETMVCHELFDDAYLRSSELYNEFMRKYEWRYTAVFRLLEQDGQTVMVGLQRPAQFGPFEPREREWMLAARPHLARAFRIRRILQSTVDHADRCQSMVDRMPYPALLVTADGRILEQNQAAEQALRVGDGLLMRQGRLAARDHRETAQLLHLIGEAARPAPVRGGRSGACRVSRADGGFYAALVTPVRADAPAGCGTPAALLLLTDPSQRPLPSEQALRVL